MTLGQMLKLRRTELGLSQEQAGSARVCAANPAVQGQRG